MTHVVAIQKDELNEHPVPTEWRSTIARIAQGLVTGQTSELEHLGVTGLSAETLQRINENVAEYGGHLTDLPEETWNTSVCQWMRDYWYVLVDLYTEEEGRTDLVLSMRVYRTERAYRFEVTSVHVP